MKIIVKQTTIDGNQGYSNFEIIQIEFMVQTRTGILIDHKRIEEKSTHWSKQLFPQIKRFRVPLAYVTQ